MADDGDLGLGDAGHDGGAGGAALELDGLRAGLFDEADGIGDSVVPGGVIAAEGHVGDEKGAGETAADGAGVMEHLVDGDGEGVGVAEDGHGEGVADEDEVDAGGVEQARGGVVVGGERGDGGAGEFALAEGGHGDWLRHRDELGGCDLRGTDSLPYGGIGEAHGTALRCGSAERRG